MGQKLALINGTPRMTDEEAALPEMYNDYFVVVTSGASGENERNLADCETGDHITLPNSGSYESYELKVRLNGQVCDDILDFNWVGTGTKTQIAFTFDLVVGDRIMLEKDRNA